MESIRFCKNHGEMNLLQFCKQFVAIDAVFVSSA